jgi:pheromone shutdown protein TraB
VVAVIGAGHHSGIEQALNELQSQPADPEVAVPVKSTAREVTRIPINWC